MVPLLFFAIPRRLMSIEMFDALRTEGPLRVAFGSMDKISTSERATMETWS